MFGITSEDVTAWVAGIASEVTFWDTWVETKGGDWADDFNRRIDPNPEFTIPDALPYANGSVLRLLDAGAGLISGVGTKHPTVKVELHACDPLAPFYTEILNKHGVRPYVATEFAFVEDLTSRYAKDYFDVAHVRNALDHSFAPLSGIHQLVSVTKLGGAVLLSHYENEAEFGGYSGLHQWNFTERNGRFIIWNKNHNIDVGQVLANYADVTTTRVTHPHRDFILAKIVKRNQPEVVNTFKNVFDEALLRMLAAQTGVKI
jgi:hypothetical protein